MMLALPEGKSLKQYQAWTVGFSKIREETVRSYKLFLQYCMLISGLRSYELQTINILRVNKITGHVPNFPKAPSPNFTTSTLSQSNLMLDEHHPPLVCSHE